MNTEHTKRILEWRDALTVLPDNQFFELMRMYLGEIKTPFNKQNLIENLSSFLRKNENKQKIVNLLSESDLKVIAACTFIKNATQKKLTTFFEGTFTFSKLYERILNLEERLILYRKNTDGKILLCVNPHLDEVFEKVVKKSVLVKNASVTNKNTKDSFSISSELLMAFASFVNQTPDLSKADGTFKKKTLKELDICFPNMESQLLLIKKAFENLLILINDENGKSIIDKERFISFSKLPKTFQYAFICVASQGRFSRQSLSQQAKLLIETTLNIPECGYTKENLLRSAYIKSERKKDNVGESHFGTTSRFAAILQRAKQEEVVDSISEKEDIFSILDRLLDCAIELGFLKIKGIEKDGTDVFEANENLKNELKIDLNYDSNQKKVLNIDSAYNVMLFQGLNLKDLISLSDFLELKKFDTAISFEITKKSIMRGFDNGLSESQIIEILQKYCIHELPQNLLVSIQDWKKTYSSTTIYYGYVLKVSGENIALSQKNPIFASHILEVLAENVYLLDVKNDEEAKKLLSDCGNDTVGKIKTNEKKNQSADFPTFYVEYENQNSISENDSVSLTTDEERKTHFDYLRAELDSMNLTQEERECLLFRVNRKIILDKSQLRAESVKFTKLEASGMDFSGKVHIIEQAILDKSTIEITLASQENFEGITTTGIPVSTQKYDDDVLVSVKIANSSVLQNFSISQANKIRRIYSSSFR